MQLNELKRRLENLKLKLDITQSAKKYLIKHGYSAEFGARPIKRAIQSVLENKIADYLIQRGHQMNFQIGVENGLVVLTSSIKNEPSRR